MNEVGIGLAVSDAAVQRPTIVVSEAMLGSGV